MFTCLHYKMIKIFCVIVTPSFMLWNYFPRLNIFKKDVYNHFVVFIVKVHFSCLMTVQNI